MGEKDSVGGSVGFGERVGDGVQFLGRGDGDGVGRGVSVGGVCGRGVGASVWAFVVASSSMVRSRRMALWARCQGKGLRCLVERCVRAGALIVQAAPQKPAVLCAFRPAVRTSFCRGPLGGSNVTAGRAGAAAAPVGAELRGLKNAQSRLVCAVL